MAPSGSAAPKGAAFMPFGCVNLTHGPSFSSLQQNNTLNLRGDNKKSSLQLFHFPKFLKANSEIAQFCLLLGFKENNVRQR